MCFAPQRCAFCDVSYDQMAPHPPLWRAYFGLSWAPLLFLLPRLSIRNLIKFEIEFFFLKVFIGILGEGFEIQFLAIFYRRKFRSQTSDNMDRWRSRGGKSQRGEEQKREDQRRERVRSKKVQARKKVGTSRSTVFREALCFSQKGLWLRRVKK